MLSKGNYYIFFKKRGGLSKIILFLSFDSTFKWLLIESFISLGNARFQKFRTFYKVAPTLGHHLQETSFACSNSNRKFLRMVAISIDIISRYTLWESKCLVKAIAAMKILEKRGIESTLYLGTRKSRDGNLIAHAWLRSGNFYVTGGEEVDKYTVVSSFAKKISKNVMKGEANGDDNLS